MGVMGLYRMIGVISTGTVRSAPVAYRRKVLPRRHMMTFVLLSLLLLLIFFGTSYDTRTGMMDEVWNGFQRGEENYMVVYSTNNIITGIMHAQTGVCVCLCMCVC